MTFLLKIVLHFLLSAAAFVVADRYLSGVTVAGFQTAIIIALVIFVLSYTVKPVLFILTLPINILTLGLFTLILNGLMFYFAANIVQGFSVITFYDAVLGALVVSVIKIIGGYIIDMFLG